MSRNRIGIYFAFWEKEWEADYYHYIDKVKRLGFDTLETEVGSLERMGKDKQAAIAGYAREAGVDLTYCIGLPPQYDVSSEDEAIRRAGVEYVKRLLETVYRMQGEMIGGILYASWPMSFKPDMEKKKRLRERSLCSIRELAKTAEGFGIDYCLEIVNRFEQCLLNTAEEGVDFVKETESPRIKLLLDSFHMNIEEDSFREAILKAGSLLGHFHIGENNRRVPGMGHINWDEIAAALKDINYEGHMVMEPFMRPGGRVGQDIRVYRDLSGNADEAEMDRYAEKALGFIREKMGGKK